MRFCILLCDIMSLNEQSLQTILKRKDVIEGLESIHICDSIRTALNTVIQQNAEIAESAAKFLSKEDDFIDALRDILSQERTVDVIKNIAKYNLHKDTVPQSYINIDQQTFPHPADFCDYFWGQTWFLLNSMQLANVLQQRPRDISYNTSENEYCALTTIWYIEPSTWALVSWLYTSKFKMSDCWSSFISQGNLRNIGAYYWGVENTLTEINRLFSDKTIYEVFDVDPLEVVSFVGE